jgi:hypothetical protein
MVGMVMGRRLGFKDGEREKEEKGGGWDVGC